MPIFDYFCMVCNKQQERNVKIDERDAQFCECGHRLNRSITFVGSVYSPTANGGMKR